MANIADDITELVGKHLFSDYTNLKKKQDSKERSLQSWKYSIQRAV